MGKKCVAINLCGLRFGRLLVLHEDGKDKRGELYWLCQCDCGNLKRVSGYKLRSGNTSSCGCLQKEARATGLHYRHRMSKSRLYSIWCNMKARCFNPKSIEYSSYGGRGIVVCEEWKDFGNFLAWSISNGYKDSLTIDRIDVNGPYSPSNCRWVTMSEQSLNRRNSHFITAFGETLTIKEWSVKTGLKYDTIERRINRYGWSSEDAVSVRPHKISKKP